MPHLKLSQPLARLDPGKGRYFHFAIPAEIGRQFPGQPRPRIQLIIPHHLELSLALNPMGDGSYYIMLARRYVKRLGLQEGDLVQFEIREDPHPLGVPMPEELEVLLEQDAFVRQAFDNLTDGRKRSLIHAMNRIKDLDRKVDFCLGFLERKS